MQFKKVLNLLFNNKNLVDSNCSEILLKLSTYVPSMIDRNEFIEWLPKFLDKEYRLNPHTKLKEAGVRNAEIFIRFYCLHNQEYITLEELGLKYNLTRERIRQILKTVINKVRKSEYPTILMNKL